MYTQKSVFSEKLKNCALSSLHGESFEAELWLSMQNVFSVIVFTSSLEKGMAACSDILAWRSPWTEEPGGFPAMGSERVGHD